MAESALSADRLHEVFASDPWHGPAFVDHLRDLTPEQADAHPIAGAHSIAEIVRHVELWMRIVDVRLQGGDAETLAANDWGTRAALDADAWRGALADLAEAEARLRTRLKQPDPRLVPGAEFDRRLRRNVDGTIAHIAYHAGQITMLRRAQGLAPQAKG